MNLIDVFNLRNVALYIHVSQFIIPYFYMSFFFLSISFLPSISLIMTRAINFELIQSVLKNNSKIYCANRDFMVKNPHTSRLYLLGSSAESESE